MNYTNDEISIADLLLKQLQDQYLAVHKQNMLVLKENHQPEDDMQNSYQPLEFDDDEDDDEDGSQLCDQADQLQSNQCEAQQHKQELANQQVDVQSFKLQIQSLRIQQTLPNPESKQLIEVQPLDQKIFTDLLLNDFQIDQDKIKSFALSIQINQPDWLKNQSLCKVRIEELFIKKTVQKPFTKI